MKKIWSVFSTITTSVTVALLYASTTLAQSGVQGGMEAARGDNLPTDIFADGGLFTTIVNTMLFIVGAVAVVMIIFGGFRYIISGGKADSITAAKNTIMYAVIGIIVALLSYAILDFVVGTFANGGSNAGL